MKKFVVTGFQLTLHSGFVKLTEEQSKARAHAIRATEETAVFEILQPINFKSGEVFFYEGDLPKNLASLVQPKKAPEKKEDEKATEVESLASPKVYESSTPAGEGQETEPDAVFDVATLAKKLGLGVKETKALLAEKYGFEAENGRQELPTGLFEQVLADQAQSDLEE